VLAAGFSRAQADLFCPALCCPPCLAAEYTAEERAQGLHNNSLKFAMESKSERGWSTNGKDVNTAPVKVVASGTI
jgi:hypothetical protein